MKDFLKIEKEIEKNEIINSCFCLRNIIDSGIFSLSTLSFLTSDSLSIRNTISLIVSLLSALKVADDLLKTEYAIKVNSTNALNDELSETDTYINLVNMYSEYLFLLNELTTDMGITTCKKLIYLYKHLLDNGIFSITGKNEYYNYKYIKGDLPETRGAKAMSGVISSFDSAELLASFLNISGHSSCVISGVYSNKLFSNIPNLRNKSTATTGIIDVYGKYLFDPTLGKVFSNVDNSLKTTVNNKEIYFQMDNDQTEANIHHEKDLEDFNKSKLKSINEEFDETIVRKVQMFFEENKGYFFEFRMQNLKLMQEIVAQSEVLTPRSDNKIVEWKVK